MKTLYLTTISAVALLLASCTESTESGAGKGSIRFASTVDGTIDTRATAAPTADDFSLTITGEGVESVWASITEFNQADTLFTNGQYTALISYGDPEVEGYDKFCYKGESTFMVASRLTSEVSITATIANSQAVVRVTDAFLDYFEAPTFKLTTASGASFDFTPTTSETPQAVSVIAGTSITLTGEARHQSPDGVTQGQAITFATQTLTPTKAATRHLFTFDAKDAGSATLTISLGDEVTEIRQLEFEMNDEAIL